MSNKDRGKCVTGHCDINTVIAPPMQRNTAVNGSLELPSKCTDLAYALGWSRLWFNPSDNSPSDNCPSGNRCIWFIRHGESQSNAGLATHDPVSIDLTSTGHQQAKGIARACKEAPSMVIVSHYHRTRQTAVPTLERFSMEPAVWDVHEFTYLAQLHGQMTTKEQRSQHVNAYWGDPKPEYVNGSGSESFVEFFLRVQRVVNQLLSLRERFIMVFSHEQFITAARWILTSGRTFGGADISVDMMTTFRDALATSPVPNGAILPVSVHNNKLQCGDIITSHLATLKQIERKIS